MDNGLNISKIKLSQAATRKAAGCEKHVLWKFHRDSGALGGSGIYASDF